MNYDAVMEENTNGLYDFTIDGDGDIKTIDSFDTAILYSLMGEKRATVDEVLDPSQRRGWIGSLDLGYENGSKIWMFEQERLTRSTINRLSDEAKDCLKWLVDDGLAISIDDAVVTVSNNSIKLLLTILRTGDIIEKRLYTFWDNTGK